MPKCVFKLWGVQKLCLEYFDLEGGGCNERSFILINDCLLFACPWRIGYRHDLVRFQGLWVLFPAGAPDFSINTEIATLGLSYSFKNVIGVD